MKYYRSFQTFRKRLKKDKSLEIVKQEIKDLIFEHLLQIKIFPGYGGNDLKW